VTSAYEHAAGAKLSRRSLIFTLAVAQFCAAGAAMPAWSAPKEGYHALVIGNAEYPHGKSLQYSVNDARGVRDAFEELGFKVDFGTNLTARDTVALIKQFEQNSARGKVAAFFYSGHGVQLRGQNYLVPTDAKLSETGALDEALIPIRSIALIVDTSDIGIVILDSCRVNPNQDDVRRNVTSREFRLVREFGREVFPTARRPLSRSFSDSSAPDVGLGMADMSGDGMNGMLFVYATSPGSVASDGDGPYSPFSESLLRHIKTPLEINAVMTRVREDVQTVTDNAQHPWVNTSLTGFYLAGSPWNGILP
jgi:uncharacterized caspase-like protein